MKKLIKIFIILIVLVLIGIIAWYNISILPVSNSEEEIEVIIDLGTGTSGIAKILKEKNIIRSELAFKIYVKLNNVNNFQAGTYYLKQNMNLEKITEILKTGIMYDKNQITITYIEGKNMRWLASKIAGVTNNTEEDVYNLLNDESYINSIIEDYWFITDEIKNKDIYYSLEGYLFPDTYALSSKDVKVEEIFSKMLDRMDSILSEYKAEINKSKYSVHQILTIASIVEMESTNQEDRAGVASVIYNRLNLKMAIQSDVTTYYAFKIDMGERDLYQKEIDTYNAYNTRGPNMEGKLPIGPVSSVGKTSIKATLEPIDSDYLFFVADKNGKIYFSKTNSEHNKIINNLMSQGLWYEY